MRYRFRFAYSVAEKSDGYRILVDRLWPRGVSKDEAQINEWNKEIAPSTSLRKWYSHDVSKWAEFKKLYFEELKSKEKSILSIVDKQSDSTVTLIYAAKDRSHSNAVALKEYIENIKSKTDKSGHK